MAVKEPLEVAGPSTGAGRAIRALAERAAALPAWVWLAGIVAVSFGARLVYTQAMVAPFNMPDELVYTELARSIAQGEGLAVRGEPAGFSPLYPAAISPLYALFDDQAHAYAAVKAVNAMLFSLVAVPAFLLARRIASRGAALVAAALSVAVPSAVYAGLVMTESLFYLLMTCTALVAVLALERPTAVRQLGLLALVALAVLTRWQALVLVPVLVTAVVLVALADGMRAAPGGRLRSAGRALRRFWIAGAALLLGAAAVVGVQLARGRSPLDLLGSYRDVASGGYPAGETIELLGYHLALLDLYVGVAPAAALAVFVILAFRPSSGFDPGRVAFAAWAAPCVFWVALGASAFSARFTPQLEERLVFHLAPLFFAALAAWLSGGMPSSLRLRVVTAAAACALVVALLPARALGGWVRVSDAMGLWALFGWREGGAPLGAVVAVVAAGCLALAILFVLAIGRDRAAVPVLLLVAFALSSWKASELAVTNAQVSLTQGLGTEVRRTWVDEATPDAAVGALWSPEGESLLALWENEVFSRKLGTVYTLQANPYDPLSREGLSVGEGGVVSRDGDPLEVPYLLVDREYANLGFAGEVVAEDEEIGTRLWRIDGPLRVEYRLRGVHWGGWLAPGAVYRQLACDGGVVAFELASTSAVERTVLAVVRGENAGAAVLPPGGAARLEVALPDTGASCRVRLFVAPVEPADRAALDGGAYWALGVRLTRPPSNAG